MYQSDKEIILSLPFETLINPIQSFNRSYAVVDEDGMVIELYLFEENSIPASIFCFLHLKTLVVINSIFHIDREISQLQANLETLHLSNIYPQHSVIPFELFTLGSLKSLQMTRCGIEHVPEAISNLTELRTLNLQRNQLMESLPSSLQQIEQLSSIDLSYNRLFNSLDIFNGSTSIRELRASHCAIDHLPLYLSHLSILDLSHNRLNSLDGIETIAAYYPAYPRMTRPFSFPQDYHKESILSDLDFSNNQLSKLPEEIYQLPFLKKINLRNNHFDTREIEWILGRFRRTKSFPILIL